MDALVLEQLAQQLQRGGLVAALLNQDVKHFAFVVDRAPCTTPCERERRLALMRQTKSGERAPIVSGYRAFGAGGKPI